MASEVRGDPLGELPHNLDLRVVFEQRQVMRLRVVVKEALTTGTPRREVLAALDDLRADEPEHEDVVLDVMDLVVGWSSPHVSLRGSGARRQARRPR